jgi:hypothetical protein
MRITQKHLEAKVGIINGMLGYASPQWDTVGAIHLYRAYGATGIHRVMNTSGGVDSLMELGTVKEASQFLSGMIAAFRIAKEQ